MGYPVKIQRVQRAGACSYYVNFPVAVAESIGATKGETWCWSLEDKDTLMLQRLDASAPVAANGRSRNATGQKTVDRR